MRVTAEQLRELLDYDSDTGIFRWRLRRGSQAAAGSIAGCVTRRGYWVIMIKHRQYLAHRLVWLYVHGRWPKDQIDHANRNCADNRLSNLREATPAQNKANSPKPAHNTSGLKGAQFTPRSRKKWRATITINGRIRVLGQFSTKEDAHAAYCAAAREHFGDFARP